MSVVLDRARPARRMPGWLVRPLPWAALVARFALAAVWAYAAVSKVGDPAVTVRAVRAYRLLPEWSVHAIAYGLPFVELALALLLVVGFAVRVASAASAVLLLIFIAGIASAWARGLQIECGCFGGGGTLRAGRANYPGKILRDSLFLVLALGLVLAPRLRWSLDERLASGPAPVATPVGKGKKREVAERLVAERARQHAAAQRRTRQLSSLGAVGVLLVAALLGTVVQGQRNKEVQPLVAPPGATSSGGIRVGATGAPVTVDLYEDFQCPICKEFEQTAGPTVRRLVASGRVAVLYHPLSFLGPESVRAANAAAAAAAAGKFAAYHDALFAHQPPERTGGFSNEELLGLGRQVGLTDSAFVDAVRRGTYDAWVRRVADLGSKAGVVGTPTVRVNSKTLADATAAALQQAVMAAGG